MRIKWIVITLLMIMIAGCTAARSAAQTTSRIDAPLTTVPTTPTFTPHAPIPTTRIVPTMIPIITPVTETIAGQFDLRQALQLMYGDTGTVREGTNGFVVEIPHSDFTDKAVLNLVVGYQEDGTDKYQVVTARAFDTCHPCLAIIDAAIFSRHNDRWQVDVNQKGITAGGSMGHIDKGSWVPIGPDKYGVLLTGTYCGQGACGDTTILIAEVDGIFREVFRQQTAGDYHDPIDPTRAIGRFISHVQFRDSFSSSSYYDLVVEQAGTDQNGKALPEKSVYTFSNGKYELVSQP